MVKEMPRLNKYLTTKKRKEARRLYKEGLTTRVIGKALGMSHTWVWEQVRDLSTVEELTQFDSAVS